MKAGLDGSKLDPLTRCNLSQRLAVDVMQRDHPPQILRKLLERCLQALSPLALLHHRICAWLERRLTTRERNDGASRPMSIDQTPVSNRDGPGPKRATRRIKPVKRGQ